MSEIIIITEQTLQRPTAANKVASFIRPAKMALITVHMNPKMFVEIAGTAIFPNKQNMVYLLGASDFGSNKSYSLYFALIVASSAFT